MFVLIEGIDRIGKTTLINKLALYYRLFGHKVHVWNDFDSVFGKKVKDLFHVEQLEDSNRLALLRNLRKFSTIKLDELFYSNDIVILDRFALSTIAYQSNVDNLSKEWELLRRYKNKMITILLTCKNIDFIKDKINQNDPLETCLLHSFDTIQDRFISGLFGMKEFCSDSQLEHFELDKNYVVFSDVVRKIDRFHKNLLLLNRL